MDNPSMVYILASPRSGSTLLRVMLEGHSRLFSPPELNLLPFCNMLERDVSLGDAATAGFDCDPREGLVEAVASLLSIDWTSAERRIRASICQATPITCVLGSLRALAFPRILVDKSILNASFPHALEKSLHVTPSAKYIHLVREPRASIASTMRVYYASLGERAALETALPLWCIPNENILAFFDDLHPSRRMTVRYEALVTQPESTVREICKFLGIEFEPAMLQPYSGQRMTKGRNDRSYSVGDRNFHQHDRIDASLAAPPDDTVAIALDPRSVRISRRVGYTFSSECVGGRESATPGGTIILVMPPYSYRTDAYLAAARKLGLRTACAIDSAYGMTCGGDVRIAISYDAPERSAHVLAHAAFELDAQAIVSTDDGAVEIAAMAGALARLPHNPAQAVRAANDKLVMRELLERSGVRQPRYSHHWFCEDPREIAADLVFPVVLKPLYLSGSRGVIRANDDRQFADAFRRLARILREPGTGPEPRTFLVEQYVPGLELALEGILVDGDLRPLALYDKPDPMEGPYFEETMLITPSRLSAAEQSEVIVAAREALSAVGMRQGPVHVELRYNEQGAWLIEFAARTIGGDCSGSLPFQGGRTLEEVILGHAVHGPADHIAPADGAHGVMMIPIPGHGVFRGVAGTEAAKGVPGVSGLRISVVEGDLIQPLPEGHRYVGFIFAHAATPDAVEVALRTANDLLRFDLGEVSDAGAAERRSTGAETGLPDLPAFLT